MSAYRGRLPARALVIDVRLLGEAEGRRRVVDAWQPGSAVFVLPDGSWLLEYDQPIDVRAELAPGLVLVDSGGVLHPAGTATGDAESGDVLIPRAGTTTRVRRTELIIVDRSTWVDVTDLRIDPVATLDRTVTAATTPLPWQPPAPAPDLRKLAGIMPPSRGSRRLLAAVARPGSRSRTTRTGPAVATMPRIGRASSGGGRWGALLAGLVLAGPAAWLARRPQERYVRRLTNAFRQRDWDTALREAIAVAGPGGGTPTLRLPRPRTGELAPHARLRAGSSFPLGHDAHDHLRALYRQAATDLERAGRIPESAFVLADLLDLPTEAIGLLERHGHGRLAATLAEGRELEPELIVRLWWRAGDRDRAVQVARARGAFAGAVERLAKVDPTAATQLRVEWIRDRQAAADHCGAVDAAWPEEQLRPLVVADIQAGMALGGHLAGYLFAHLATWRPDAETARTTNALLTGRDPDLVPAQRGFVSALAELRCTDAAYDRRWCTSALRLLVGDQDSDAPGDFSTRERIARVLRDRADLLAAVDLPVVRAKPAPSRAEVVEVAAPTPAGQLPVHDAVALPGNVLLTAHGEFGVRLTDLTGQSRASWDVPAHQLVVSDHGTQVLLVSRRGRGCEVRRLDLATRRLRPPVLVTAQYMLPSYDGTVATVIDDDGIAFVDLNDAEPRIIWRELDSTMRVLRIDRNPTSLVALVRIHDELHGTPSTQVWQWELPSLMLRTRERVEIDGVVDAAMVAPLTILTTWHDPTRGSYQVTCHGKDPLITPERPTLLASCGLSGVRVDQPDRTVVEIPEDKLRIAFPATTAMVGMRRHGDTVVIWEQAGRLVAFDLAERNLISRLRTRL